MKANSSKLKLVAEKLSSRRGIHLEQKIEGKQAMNSINWNGKPLYPTKIICVGRNYSEHITELNNRPADQPVLFIKPNSAIASEIYATPEETLHFESELSFLIEAGKAVAVGFGLDLTKRKLQSQLKTQGLPWERAKAFDHSAVFSEFVSFSGNNLELGIELSVNDKFAQQGHCQQMIYKPEYLFNDIQKVFTLEDGDIVMTGTPKGVAEVHRGDRYHGKVLYRQNTLVEAHWVVK